MTALPIVQSQLFVHTKRAEWGRAMLIRDEDEWLQFVFEDGQQRKFGRSHAHLLADAALPPDEQARVVRTLSAMVPATTGTTRPLKKAKKATKKATKKAAKPANARTLDKPDGTGEAE